MGHPRRNERGTGYSTLPHPSAARAMQQPDGGAAPPSSVQSHYAPSSHVAPPPQAHHEHSSQYASNQNMMGMPREYLYYYFNCLYILCFPILSHLYRNLQLIR